MNTEHITENTHTPLHLPTENSGECSICFLPWPCPVAVAWEQAHAVFCSRGGGTSGLDVCSTHLRPGDRYMHQHLRFPPVLQRGGEGATQPAPELGEADE